MQTGSVVALGFFDGVHLGHGALLTRARQKASQLGCPATVLSFDRHPSALIAGHSVPLINTVEDRQRLMMRYYHIDKVVLAPFHSQMMHMPWQTFVKEYLAATLHPVHIICGHDYHFGYRGEGTPQRLAKLCQEQNWGCDVIDKVSIDGITVSSTYIRSLIGQGKIREANRFLGHPHLLTGQVIPGNRIGATLGFPTANLLLPPGIVCPLPGVYATKVNIQDRSYMAVTNVGTHPTVGPAPQTLVESWILNFSGDLYGKEIQVEFYDFLRQEQTFSSLAALKAAIGRNAEQVRAFFA